MASKAAAADKSLGLTRPLWWPRFVSLVLLCVLVGAGAPALAQETRSASRSQRKLIQLGLDAHAAGSYDKAAVHFRAANAESELNIVWLNLGRALQKGGDCAGAKKAYEQAPRAAAVPRPPAELVDETAAKYMAELNSECPGWIRVVCAQPDIELEVETRPLTCGSSVELPAGTYTVNASWRGQHKSETATVAAFETASLSFGFKAKDPGPHGETEPDGGGSDLGLYAWIATGVSVALVGTGAVIAGQRGDTIDRANATNRESEYRSLRDEYDDQSTLMWTTFGLGLAAGTAAGFLFYLDSQEPDGVGFWFGPTTLGMEVRF